MAIEDGYIKLYRKFFDNPLWKERREFSKAEAWIDLLATARFDESEAQEFINGQLITWGRGQLIASLRYLQQRWGWSKHKVELFLKLLQSQGMIRIDHEQNMGRITLCNYEVYNELRDSQGTVRGQLGDTRGTLRGQSGDKTNKDKKDNKVKEGKEEREEAPRTDPESSESEIQSLEPEEDIATSCSNILSLALSAPDESTAAEETESVSRKFERPTLQQVKEHFDLSGFPISEGENFWSYYDGRDWEDNRGSPIAFWRSLVIGWMNKSKHFINTGNGNDSAIDNKTSFNSRLNPTVDRDEFSQSVRTYQERYG